ncbi:MAG: hypothetical protein JSW71_17960 [Gemmatimonadota bacterium]|nr:MAG: hypothetical protein JSW71_17960 [Gemmatimonadota bacterium]
MKYLATAAALFVALSSTTPCAAREEAPELVQPSEWWRVHPRPVYASLEKAGTFQQWFDMYELA